MQDSLHPLRRTRQPLQLIADRSSIYEENVIVFLTMILTGFRLFALAWAVRKKKMEGEKTGDDYIYGGLCGLS